MSDFEMELDLDAAEDIAPGTFLFGVLDIKGVDLKDDTGAPSGAKAVVIDYEVITGTNPEMAGRAGSEFLRLPHDKDDAKNKALKNKRLIMWAKALRLVEPDQKGKPTIKWANGSGRQFCAAVVHKGGYVNLNDVVRDDDPSVAHIVAAHHGNKPNGKLVGAAAGGPSIDI